jgi:dienelactone hydrolase
MAKTPPPEWDALAEFTVAERTFLGQTKTVYSAGQGPAVIVIHELPGITPQVARFARFVRAAGFTVVMPVLTGDPGRPISQGYLLGAALKVCISREFAILGSADRTSPVVDWLRALAGDVFTGCGGRGVGIIGMCFSGNFGLAMALEPAVRAAVLCQPSLPANQPAGLHVAPGALTALKARLDAEDITLQAYRFAGDKLCPAARFDALTRALGARVNAVTLPDSAAKQGTGIAPHSVVTTHLIDEAGQPTRQAVDDILAYLQASLL